MIYKVIQKARGGQPLNKAEVLSLLNAKEGEEAEALYSAAREIRKERYGNKIFPYGFVYFSTSASSISWDITLDRVSIEVSSSAEVSTNP